MRWLFFLVLGILIGLHIAFRYEMYKPQEMSTPVEVLRCDTVVVRDTIREPVPVPVTRVRVDTVLLAPIVQIDSTSPSPIAVELSIEQQEYRGDGWRAWVSGYGAALDSLAVDRRTITVDREVTRWRRQHWGFSAGLGVAIDRRGRVGPALYAGFGYTF